MTPDLRLGLICGFTAYTLWGLLPLYFRVLDGIAPAEMLAHRILWSVPTGFVFIALARNWRDIRGALTKRRLGYLALSSFFIGLNWLVYIWAVDQERVTGASLGYYANPLVSVAFGAMFLSETLRRAQWAAIALAATGVVVLAVAQGALPYVPLILCMSFATYGLIRKQVRVDGRIGFVIEACLLSPIALGWMIWFTAQPEGRLLGETPLHHALLPLAGVITAVPLILFALAAKRLKLSTIGMMQYLTPTMQFLIGTVLFGEAFGPAKLIAFLFIWTALAIFTTDSLINERRARRLARAARNMT